jgi:hypothetical protein
MSSLFIFVKHVESQANISQENARFSFNFKRGKSSHINDIHRILRNNEIKHSAKIFVSSKIKS